jgi:tetratricopeptide (TPR) repeat protein
MDSQTVRTALGTLQANPDADAWGQLTEGLNSQEGDLGLDESLELLDAARVRHAERGEWHAVARLLELSAQLTAGEPREAAYWKAHAQIASAELFDEDAAAASWTRLLELQADDAEAAAQLAEAEERRTRWSELASTYAAEAETASDDVYQSAMLMRSAEVEVRYATSPRLEVALELLERAVRLDTTNTAAAKLLEVVYRRQGKWEEAARVLERVADRSPEASVRVAAGVRLARIYLHKLGDEERAARAYDRVLIDDPAQADALDYVTTFFSQHERWDALVRVYERPLEAANATAEDKLGEMLQIAMLHWRKRQSLPDAEVWFERIRKLDPANDGMLAFYREYKKTLDDDAGLAQILAGAQRALPEGDPRRTEIAQEVAQLAESQANAQKAVEQYKSILRQDPDNAEARDALKRLYKQTQGHNALVQLLLQQLERTPESAYEERLAILREVASVYREYVKSDTALVSVLNQIVQLDGQLDEHDIGEVRELVSLYQKLGRWRDLLSSQQLLAELVSDVDEKKRLFREVARRWLDQFSNVQHAMDAYAALHTLDPADQEAIERLEELYRKRRAWKELFALYEEQLVGRSGPDRIPLLREMAQLAAERLNRGSDAVAYYQEILDLDPSRMDVLDRLERHAERSKDWAALADVLERRLTVLEDVDSKLIVLQKLGAVYSDHLGDGEKAIGAWQRVLGLEPRQPRAMRVLRDTFLRTEDFDALEELYTSQGDHEGLVEVLSNAADRAPEAATKIALSYRAARIYEEQLGQPDRAFRSYERILANDPSDTRAAAKLLPLYEADEKWARMPALYEILLQGAEEPAAKLDWLEKLVEVTGQKLMDRRAAALHARRAYEISPADPRALELLEATARASGHWDELVTALEARLVDLEALPVSEVVSQSEEAAQSSEELEQAAGGGASGRSRKRRNRRKKTATVTESAPVPVAPSGEAHEGERRTLCLKLATVYADELNRVDDAVGKLQGVLERRPTDGRAAELLESILRRGDRRDGLRWLNELRVEHAPSDEERVATLNEWAQLEEGAFGELANARRLYSRALELAPHDAVALAASVRLALADGDFPAAADCLARQRELASGNDRALRDLELAELYATRLGQAEAALEVTVLERSACCSCWSKSRASRRTRLGSWQPSSRPAVTRVSRRAP